jgi:hypothetical protein
MNAAAAPSNGNGRPKVVEPAVEVPQHDLTAERSALGAVLTDPSLVPVLFEHCRPDHFYSDCNQWIARAIQAVEVVNIATVTGRLREINRYQQVGGSPYVAQLFDSVPAGSADDVRSYAEIIRAKWELRTCKAEALMLASACQLGALENPAKAFRDAANRVEGISRRAAVQLLGTDDIFAVSNHVGCYVPGLGIKAGPPALVAARGGIGKSVILQAAAISAILGQPLWGLFPVKRPLRVVWIDLEQGRQTTLLRFKRLALAADLTPDDLRGQLDVAISPDVSDESHLTRLFEGYDLAVIDCFRVLAAGVDENDSRAREPIDACARASEKTDCAVIIVHHARKTTENNRGGTRDVMRGSSAIQDAADAVFFIDRDGDEPEGPIHCQCVKVPRATGKAPQPWTLEIQDVDLHESADVVIRDGGLMVVGSRQGKTDPFEQKREQTRINTERVRRALLPLFVEQHVWTSAEELAAKAHLRKADVYAALAGWDCIQKSGQGNRTTYTYQEARNA